MKLYLYILVGDYFANPSQLLFLFHVCHLSYLFFASPFASSISISYILLPHFPLFFFFFPLFTLLFIYFIYKYISSLFFSPLFSVSSSSPLLLFFVRPGSPYSLLSKQTRQEWQLKRKTRSLRNSQLKTRWRFLEDLNSVKSRGRKSELRIARNLRSLHFVDWNFTF